MTHEFKVKLDKILVWVRLNSVTCSIKVKTLNTIRTLRIIITTQRSYFMNPHRKCINWHLTYKGHYMLSLPYECSILAYCYEEEQQKHTHVVMQTVVPTTKAKIIKEASDYLEEECELQVDSHKNIQTALGYHLGMGDKHRCTDLAVVIPSDFNPDDWIKAKIMHKPRGIFQNATRNKIILDYNNKDLIDQGLIPIEKLITVVNNKNEYARQTVDEREELPDPIPNPWGLYLPNDRDNKRCHYWIWSSGPNWGKSTLAGQLVHEYRGELKNGGFDWWNIREDCDFICLDEYRSGLKYNDLNSICDGNYDFRIFLRGYIRLKVKPIVIVFSNFSIEDSYPNMKELLYARFNEFKLD